MVTIQIHDLVAGANTADQGNMVFPHLRAAMAGCQPTESPVVPGGLQLLRREAWLLHGVQGTVAAWSRGHGMLRREGYV